MVKIFDEKYILLKPGPASYTRQASQNQSTALQKPAIVHQPDYLMPV